MVTNENSYDRTPYGQHCHWQTHPVRLATIGTLFGMKPCDPRRARVLELGCASGTNLIPMAFQLPEASFVGVDLSEKQLEVGRAEIAELGLSNIRLEHRSILDVDEDAPEFDYVICHGVYSWVADDVRRKIFSICANLLRPQGVAHVSYNTLPGWHMVRSVRDMMRYHAQRFDEPEEQVQQARALLRFMTSSWEGQDSPYAALLRSESEILAGVDDSYLLHDHLADVNRPIYLYEFIDGARAQGLQYLADGSLASMLPENLPHDVHQKLREINSIVRLEQYMDFVRGRRFRNTLLCRQDVPLNRELNAGSLESFYVDSTYTPEIKLQPRHLAEGVEVTFEDQRSTLRVSGRIGKTALSILLGKKRRPLTYGELVDAVSDELGMERDAVGQEMEQELDPCRLAFSGSLEISTLPASHTVAIEERPLVTRLARYQAGRHGRATNEKHELISLGPADRLIVQHLDGSKTIDEVAALVVEEVRKGDLELDIKDRPVTDSSDLESVINAYCREILTRLRDNALLIPSWTRLSPT